MLKEAIAKAGYTDKIQIGMDTAASEFHKDGKYDLDFKNPSSDPAKWLSGEYGLETTLISQSFFV